MTDNETSEFVRRLFAPDEEEQTGNPAAAGLDTPKPATPDDQER